MIRFGVIGSGPWGTKVIQAIRGLGFQVSVCNRHGEFDGQEVARDYRTLIPEVDIVWVAAHPNVNCEIAAYALEHNKPTVVEKPVAFTSQQVAGLVRASKAKQVPLIVDYIWMFNRSLRTFLSAEPWATLAITLGNDGPKRDYSALWDYGSHAIAVALNDDERQLTQVAIESGGVGAYRVLLHFDDGAGAIITVGNEYAARQVQFETRLKSWRRFTEKPDDKPLQALTSAIACAHLRGEYHTNGDLAVEVTDLLERLHAMLPKT
jgi:hypothetical protein